MSTTLDRNNLIHDKKNLVQKINKENGNVGLILGSGEVREFDSYFTTDAIDYPQVDIVGDVFDVLRVINNETVDNIYAYHFLEHVSDIVTLIAEVTRVLKNDGQATFVVPHFSNPFYYSDPTHRIFFGLYSFCYLAEDKVGFRRKRLAGYVRQRNLHLVDVKLVFKSYKPNYFRHGIFKVLQGLFNLSRFTQELYEEIFSHFIGCFELHYTLKAVK